MKKYILIGILLLLTINSCKPIDFGIVRTKEPIIIGLPETCAEWRDFYDKKNYVSKEEKERVLQKINETCQNESKDIPDTKQIEFCVDYNSSKNGMNITNLILYHHLEKCCYPYECLESKNNPENCNCTYTIRCEKE